MIQRQGSISDNIVLFCRFLRGKGFTVSTEEEATALNALQFIELSQAENFQLALKASLCRSKKQLDVFNELFSSFWKELNKSVDAKIREEKTKKPAVSPEQQFKSLNAWLNGNRNEETEETAAYSWHENLMQKDFSAVPQDELEELMQCLRSLSKQLAARANRRYKNAKAQQLPDLRQTLRKNLRRGGELLDIVYRQPKKNRVKLVILCDVSRSMELYSAFMLQFMYAFQQVFSRLETFVFSTSLKRITSLLKENNFHEAMEKLGQENSGWSGGTRIGECLEEFSNEFADNLLNRKTIVIILSDGWDTGDADLLRKNMENIHSRSSKLIWLNPLAGYHAYMPETTGMQTAMPYIDVFAPVHNAASLRKIGSLLW
jgi:uncharacterized protein with von Willebrand factor type A (vWA) domain